ncbi:MAG: hypothetical protein MK212_07715 [Saprospiraceae bacterium]|nr:hypothetical protein [Saprospiraceae bacterium]
MKIDPKIAKQFYAFAAIVLSFLMFCACSNLATTEKEEQEYETVIVERDTAWKGKMITKLREWIASEANSYSTHYTYNPEYRRYPDLKYRGVIEYEHEHRNKEESTSLITDITFLVPNDTFYGLDFISTDTLAVLETHHRCRSNDYSQTVFLKAYMNNESSLVAFDQKLMDQIHKSELANPIPQLDSVDLNNEGYTLRRMTVFDTTGKQLYSYIRDEDNILSDRQKEEEYKKLLPEKYIYAHYTQTHYRK